MNHLEVIFKHGKLYDKARRKRILLNDGASFVLVADNQAFSEDDDPLNRPISLEDCLNVDQMRQLVSTDSTVLNFDQLLPAGAELEFDIYLSLPLKEDPVHYRFLVRLLEELYLVQKSTFKNPDDSALADCKCVVIGCLTENLEFFEPIYAESLNQALSRTVSFYFSNQRTAGGSVYEKMRLAENASTKLGDIRQVVAGRWNSKQVKNI